MKFLLFAFVILTSPLIAQTDEQITLALQSGNSKELCRFLGDNVSVKIIDVEDIYSKTQAEMIIKDFFAKNKPQSYTPRHNGTSRNGSRFTIGRLVTSNGAYRTSYFTKKVGNLLVIQEFRIEKE